MLQSFLCPLFHVPEGLHSYSETRMGEQEDTGYSHETLPKLLHQPGSCLLGLSFRALLNLYLFKLVWVRFPVTSSQTHSYQMQSVTPGSIKTMVSAEGEGKTEDIRDR